MLWRVYAGGFLATVALVVAVQSRVFALARALVDSWHFRLALYILTAAFGVVPAVHWTHLNLGLLEPLASFAPSLCAFLAHFAAPDSASPSVAVASEPDLVYAYLPYVLLMYTLSCLAFSIYLAKVCTCTARLPPLRAAKQQYPSVTISYSYCTVLLNY